MRTHSCTNVKHASGAPRASAANRVRCAMLTLSLTSPSRSTPSPPESGDVFGDEAGVGRYVKFFEVGAPTCPPRHYFSLDRREPRDQTIELCGCQQQQSQSLGRGYR